MYNNTEHLELGKDYYNLKTGEYMFTYIFDGMERIHEIKDNNGESKEVPTKAKPYYSESLYDSFGYIKGTGEVLDEDGIFDICYNNVMVTKERLDKLNKAKEDIQSIITDTDIKEPFIFEDGKLSVGKENVLSAHVNAGYDHGWISSSICW